MPKIEQDKAALDHGANLRDPQSAVWIMVHNKLEDTKLNQTQTNLCCHDLSRRRMGAPDEVAFGATIAVQATDCLNGVDRTERQIPSLPLVRCRSRDPILISRWGFARDWLQDSLWLNSK